MDAKSDADVAALRQEIEQLRTDLSKIGETLKAIVSDRAEATQARVRAAADRAAAQAQSAADAVSQEIGERPFASVATAFGVGIVLGMLFGHRS